MSSRPALSARLNWAEKELGEAAQMITNNSARLPGGVAGEIEAAIAARKNIAGMMSTLSARTAAWSVLRELEKAADLKDDSIAFGASRIKFADARLLATQAYLSATWALSDKVVDLVGPVAFTKSLANNPNDRSSLAANVLGDGKATSLLLHTSTRDTFGWPIALSYVLRNLFLHEGGHRDGWNFFAGSRPVVAFEVGKDGWDYLGKLARNRWSVDETYTRAPEKLPGPQTDLRETLATCEREMDDALGILLVSTCVLVRGHIAALIGEI